MSYVDVNGLGSASPSSFQAALRANSKTVDTVAGMLQGAGAFLTSTLLFAGVGVPLVAAGAVLLGVRDGGVSAQTVRSQAGIAAEGLRIMNTLSGLIAAVATISIVGIAAAPVALAAVAICTPLERCFSALAAGRAPSSGDLLTVVDALQRFSDEKPIDTAMLRQFAGGLDKVLGLGKPIPQLQTLNTQAKSSSTLDSMPPELRAKVAARLPSSYEDMLRLLLGEYVAKGARGLQLDPRLVGKTSTANYTRMVAVISGVAQVARTRSQATEADRVAVLRTARSSISTGNWPSSVAIPVPAALAQPTAAATAISLRAEAAAKASSPSSSSTALLVVGGLAAAGGALFIVRRRRRA